MSFRNRTASILAVLALASLPSWGADDGRINLAVDASGHLRIAGATGAPLELSTSALDRKVVVGGVELQASFGRDANGLLTAVVTSQAPLRLDVAGKTIDADKSVVTLTFSRDGNSVDIDPGYVGTVTVDSHRLQRRQLAEDAPVKSSAPASVPTPSVPEIASTSFSQVPVTAAAPAAVATPEAPVAPMTSVPPSIASQIAPILPPTATAPSQPIEAVAAATAPVAPAAAVAAAPVHQVKLYWSEPVTGPDGKAPPVGRDEVRLVELAGQVVVVLPGGQIENGAEGLLVPSGATVRTLENSSVALFMGGVNSARLAPKCDLSFTQTLDNGVRHDVIDLKHGAVFSRIGQLDGEREDFQVRTPEGTSGASSPEMLAVRGTPDELRGVTTTTTRSGLILDARRLLAWDPAPASRGLISDVADSLVSIDLAAQNSYYYYTQPGTTSGATRVRREVFSSYGEGDPTNADLPDTVLVNALGSIDPFNTKLKTLLGLINKGTASAAQLKFFRSLTTIFFNTQLPDIVAENHKSPHAYAVDVLLADKALQQDLIPFKVAPLTAY